MFIKNKYKCFFHKETNTYIEEIFYSNENTKYSLATKNTTPF